MDLQRETIRDYRDPIFWKAMDIVEQVYLLTREFPREEMCGMMSQVRGCAASIPANIAEGFGRAQRRAFIQFLRIAQGLLQELETHMALCGRVGLLPQEESSRLEDHCARLGKRLVTFVSSLDLKASPL